MAIITNIANLSQTASLNGPDGAVDPPSSLDDQDRYLGSFIAQLRDGVGYTPGAPIIALGYTPVQQGGGVGMLPNKVRIGWNGTHLLAAVDDNAFGNIWPIVADKASGVSSGGTVAGQKLVFNWSDPGGASPAYVFCGASATNLFVRPPAALSVGHANTASTATNATTASNANTVSGIGPWRYQNLDFNPGYLWSTQGSPTDNFLVAPGNLSVNYANSANTCNTANNANNLGGQGIDYFINSGGSAVRNLRNNGFVQMIAHVAGIGDVFWGSNLSDERLKKDIAPTSEDSLAKIERLEFIQHRFRDDLFGSPIDDGRLHPIALRAQQAESIDPEWISNVGSWKQPDLYPLLCDALHAIQQLSAKVKALVKQIDANAGN
jgi:hypothetical protein